MEMFEPAPENFKARTKSWVLWFVLVALASVLRLAPIGSGLPYSDYVDEGFILHPAIRIANSKIDTSAFTYPPLTSYLTAAAIRSYAPFYRLVHHHKLRKDFPTDHDFHTELGEQYDLITPPDVIWLGRFVVACLSIATVILTGALAKLLGGSRVGYLAMLFTALCPALVNRGSIVIIDTTATFFVVATLYFCQRMRVFAASNSPAMRRGVVLAGIASGLAAGAKYTVGVVFAAVVTTILTLPIPKKSKAILIFIAGAGLFVGISCGVAGVALHPGKIVEQLRFAAGFYQTIHSEHGYWSAALSGWEVGAPLMFTGLAGIVWMFWNPSTRSVAISWIAFAFLLLAAVVWTSFQPFRNLLSLVPPLCIAAALLCNWLGEQLEQRYPRPAFTPWLFPVLVLVVACSLAWFSVRQIKLRTSHVDTRIRAIDWLQQHATKKDTVLGIRELSILPAEWKRIAARTTVVPWFEAAALLERQRFDYVVTGEFDLRYASDPSAWSAYRDRWKAKISAMKVLTNFGEIPTPVVPYLWRTSEERILILKSNSP